MGTPISNVGDGISSFMGTGMPSAVTVTTTPSSQHMSYQKIYVCTDTRSMETALNVNAAVAVSSSWGSASARMSFINNSRVNSTSIVILAVAYSQRGGQTVSSVQFNKKFDSAADLYSQSGDSYVSSITTGAQFIGSYTFEAYDELSYQKLVAAADASFGGLTTDFNAEFDTNLQQITTQTSINWTYEKTALGIAESNLPPPDKMIDYVESFNTVPIDGAYILDYAVTSYIHVADHPVDFAVVEGYRKKFIDSNPDDMGYADLELLTDTYMKAVTDVRDFYDIYGLSFIDPNFVTVLANLAEMKRQLSDWRDAVDSDPTNDSIPDPELLLQYLQLPTPVLTVAQDSPQGAGNGGGSFMDIGLPDVANGIKLSVLNCNIGEVMDNIQQTWVFNAPGTATQSRAITRGDGGGNPQVPLVLGESERIVQVDIGWDNYLHQIKITTDMQTWGSWPLNFNDNNHYTWVVPSDCFFIGFSGITGKYMLDLSAVYAKFSPATWKTFYTPSQREGLQKKVLTLRPTSPPASAPATKPHQNGIVVPSPQKSQGLTSAPQTILPFFKGLYSRDLAPAKHPLTDAETFFNTIVGWAQTAGQNFKFYHIYQQKGGWEGWAQVEIAYYIQQLFPTAQVQREVKCYLNNDRRCDFAVLLPGDNQNQIGGGLQVLSYRVRVTTGEGSTYSGQSSQVASTRTTT
jgi:hypothetical protein